MEKDSILNRCLLCGSKMVKFLGYREINGIGLNRVSCYKCKKPYWVTFTDLP